MERWQVGALRIVFFALAAMLTYIYAPRRRPPPPRIPPELLLNDPNIRDPFRDHKELDRKLEDLGRFNVRYNEADGAFEWPWSVILGKRRR